MHVNIFLLFEVISDWSARNELSAADAKKEAFASSGLFFSSLVYINRANFKWKSQIMLY